jgi:hypothetical protein
MKVTVPVTVEGVVVAVRSRLLPATGELVDAASEV